MLSIKAYRPIVTTVSLAILLLMVGCDEDASSVGQSRAAFARDTLQMFVDSLYTAEISVQIVPPAPVNSSLTLQAGSSNDDFFTTDPPFRFGDLVLPVSRNDSAVSFAFDPAADNIGPDGEARVEFEIVALGEGLITDPLAGRFLLLEIVDNTLTDRRAPYEEDFSNCLAGIFPPPGWREIVVEQNEENSARWACITSPAPGISINAFVPGSSDSGKAEVWMLSPTIDLGSLSDPALRFQVDRRFNPIDPSLEAYDLLIASDYDGNNFATASWERFPAGYAAIQADDPGADGFSDSSALSLSDYKGQDITFAFVYRAGATNNTDATILRIADFSVR